ncbi:MAG: SgcJ/EcaC family oxidoreductase [Planctomycetota bacterium]|nr:SgcJ/EcaC family oxidoreductase [Planctomycetota bacterium]
MDAEFGLGLCAGWQAAAPAPAKPAAGVAAPAEGAVVEVDIVEVAVIEAPPAPPELVEAVQKAELATIEAFNKGDAAALAALFAEKGELVDENGNVFAGREQITGLFKAFFERFPKAQLQMEVTGVRTVGDSLAIEEGVRLITVPDSDVAAQVRYAAVRDKVGDSWPIASYSEFADDPAPTPAEMLSAVSFLVGDWIDESPEGKTTISYRWEDDGNFLLGDYTLAVAGMPESRSHQRIGWDPLEGVIRSWTFDSDGGYSTGEWVATEAGWVIKSDATMPDGTTGSATVTVTPTDADHFIVRSSDRIIGGVDEPEFELTVARRPPQPGAALPGGEAKPATEAPKASPTPAVPAAKPAAVPATPAVKIVPAAPAPAAAVKPATPAPAGVRPAVPGVPAVPATPVVPGKPLAK